MTRPPVHDSTQAFLDAITPPAGKSSSEHTDSVYALVEPLHAVLEAVETRLATLDSLRRAADRQEDAVYAYTFFERFKESVKAARRQTAEVLAGLEALTDTVFQIDDYAHQMNRSLDTHIERNTPAQELVTMPRAELDHLQARHAELQAVVDAIPAPKPDA